jgi:hypothetical protein
MAKFIYLEEAQEYLNVEYVTRASKHGDGLAVWIVGQDEHVSVEGNDVHNLRSLLDGEVKGRR